jgi:manganese/iron transport system permease protein
MPDLLEPLSYTFMQRALTGTFLVALLTAGVGIFVILRGLAFLGDAISHAAFPGVVIAFLLKVNIVLGGSIAAVASALTIGLVARRSGLREDAAIGIVYSGMFALGVVIFSGIKAYTGDLLGILFGNVLGINDEQLVILVVAVAIIAGVVTFLWKELIFVSFDPTGAAAAGLPVLVYDTLLLGVVGVTIAVSVQIVGIILVAAMLVTPAATARLVSRDLRTMLLVSVGVAVASGIGGLYFSYFLNSASGGTIVLVATALFGLVWLLRSARAMSAAPA